MESGNSTIRPIAPPRGCRLEDRFENLYGSWWPSIERLIYDAISEACPADSLLKEMAIYHIKTGGKRLRAVLPLLVAQAMESDPRKLIAFGAACETLHNASLVHDDIQDGDTVRRGEPTVWHRFGTAQAINVGDALIACAFLLVQRLEASPNLRERLTRRMLFEMLLATDGQVRDLQQKASRRSSVADYLKMVESKTARLFALPIVGAASLCGADGEIEQALGEAAGHIGVLFQLRDDIIDTLGSDRGIGLGQDILDGNRSILIVHCLETANPREAAWFLRILDKPRGETTPEDVASAIALIENTGSMDFAMTEIINRRDAALMVPAIDRIPALFQMLDEACQLFLRGVDPYLAHAKVRALERSCLL
jgi:geranylgeranyl diphosphate synthase type I